MKQQKQKNHKDQHHSSKQKRSLTDSDKHLNPLDKIEKAEYTKQVEKIAYAMVIPPLGSSENVKIKVMDHIESKCFF